MVENDERVFSVDDVLALSTRTGTPVIFDVLHDRCNPGTSGRSLRERLEDCFATWKSQDGPPKVHFSTQAGDKRLGAHADYVDPDDFLEFLEQAPNQVFDCMLEAKAKDVALFELRRQLKARGIAVEVEA